MNRTELAERGIKSTSMELYHVKDGLIASRTEGGNGKKPSFWTTAFTPFRFRMKKNLYSINTFTFENEQYASDFHDSVSSSIEKAEEYFKNKNESIHVEMGDDGKSVKIYYGTKKDGRDD